ncbi:PREDICTED: rab11 family-interacting protein 1-like [Branchiostoma belcheri]|uniref:Rab11 family-interacting protein 1-like n=1 Tax=Branchiostoma belcheri TaxID=7741 RepID=A0A6P4YVE1_BRABE|nr:PREDICTED: rab11 family-interacting protein 1-like [Branchiostoma belcheri]
MSGTAGWTPTHAKVTVHQARNLVVKGKGGTNDAYVTITLGKEKFLTSVAEKTVTPGWNEECDLCLGNYSGNLDGASVQLNIYHRSLFGSDDFLGHVTLPLTNMRVTNGPLRRWYELHNRPGKKETKKRGELEVSVSFLRNSLASSTSELSGKKKVKRTPSIKGMATTMGEKLKLVRTMSLTSDPRALRPRSRKDSAFSEASVNNNHTPVGTPDNRTHKDEVVRSSLPSSPAISQESLASNDSEVFGSSKKTAKFSLRNASLEKLQTSSPGKTKHHRTFSLGPLSARLLHRDRAGSSPALQRERHMSSPEAVHTKQLAEDYLVGGSCKQLCVNGKHTYAAADDDDDDGTSKKTEHRTTPHPPMSLPPHYPAIGRVKRTNLDASKRHTIHSAMFPVKQKVEHKTNSAPGYYRPSHGDPGHEKVRCIPEESTWEDMSKEELLRVVRSQHEKLQDNKAYIHELEDYIDDLLVRVMETTPRILQNPYRKDDKNATTAAKRKGSGLCKVI